MYSQINENHLLFWVYSFSWIYHFHCIILSSEAKHTWCMKVTEITLVYSHNILWHSRPDNQMVRYRLGYISLLSPARCNLPCLYKSPYYPSIANILQSSFNFFQSVPLNSLMCNMPTNSFKQLILFFDRLCSIIGLWDP